MSIDYGHWSGLLPGDGILTEITKFRELSPNKTQYIFDDHTIEMPHTVTITSILPSPRKGNPGTLKTQLNYHRTVIADAGLPTQRYVPQVVKIETSFPVGTDHEEMIQTFLMGLSVSQARNQDEVDRLVGLLGRGILI